MNQTLIQRYENGCLMLMDRQGETFRFLGTAFIVHSSGYLLTAAHVLDGAENLVVVNPAQPGVFSPLAAEDAGTLTVSLVQRDPRRDLALLKMEPGAEIAAPDDFLGNPETVGEGTDVLAIGISFGHLRVHNIMVMRGMLSAKILSPNDTNLLLFDATIHPGDVGGPLINTEDGRIIGILQGIFNPLAIQQVEAPDNYHLPSGFSYAVSIEYARPLFAAEGLE